MDVAGLKPRVFSRLATWSSAAIVAAAVSACGGGGGGSSPALPVAPIVAPSAAVPGAPTSSTITSVIPPSGLTATLPLFGGIGGSVAFAAPASGAGATVTVTAAAAPASGMPVLQNHARSVRNVTGAPGILYMSIVSSGALTFAGYPTISFVLPATITATADQTFSLAVFASDQSSLGYAGPIATAKVTTGASGQRTMAFTSTSTQSFSLTKGTTYEFALYAIGTAQPTPAPSPAGPTAAAPTVGYLASNGTNSFSGHLGNTTNITVVGIGTAPVNTQFSSLLGTGSLQETVSAAGASSANRSTQSSNPPRPDAAWMQHNLTVDAFVEDPQAMRRNRLTLQRASGRATQAVRYTKGLPTTLGASSPIWTHIAALGSVNGTYTQIASTLQRITAHGYIWIDNSLTTLTAAQIDQIAVDYENAYVSNFAHFGSPSYGAAAVGNQTQYATCDATGVTLKPQVTATYFVVPSDDRIAVEVLSPLNIGDGVGGYFSATNHINQSIVNCFGPPGTNHSNETPMIYVAYNGPNFVHGNPDAYELGEDLVRGTAHELQHLINFVHHQVNQVDPTDPTRSGPGEESWVNEGLSMLSQDFAVTAMYPAMTNDVDDAVFHAGNYLSAPHNFSITGFTGKDSTKVQYNCGGCYGAEYVFQRYLYDRLGGDAYLHASLNQSKVGQAGVELLGGKPFSTLIGDFGIALAASNTGATADPRWTFKHFNPRGTYTDQTGQTLTLTGPASLGALNAGASVIYTPYLGTVFYLSGPTVGNTNVSLSDSSVLGTFGLLAGVVQY